MLFASKVDIFFIMLCLFRLSGTSDTLFEVPGTTTSIIPKRHSEKLGLLAVERNLDKLGNLI